MSSLLPALLAIVCAALSVACYVLFTRLMRAQERAGVAERELARVSGVSAEWETAREKIAVLEQDIRDYTARTATLVSEKQALQEKLDEQRAFQEKTQTQAQLQFEALAQRIFEEKNTQAKQHLGELLNPLREELGGFKKHISESFGEHAKEQFALKSEIANIVKASGEMRFQTENLSRALKGDVKVQGGWGEVMLERILEASGLRKGEDYIPQATGMGLKHPEDGRTQKPDVVVMLPENKHAIIDAKVSLTAYERFCASEDEADKAAQLQLFLQSVRAHAKGLKERCYPETEGLDTPDYVLMFMPIEGAYALALQHDATLHAYAWERKVIIVCPTTLFAILRIIASMWTLDRQNKNAEAIAKRGGALYDKIAGFMEEMDATGKALSKAQGSFDNAMKRLSGGPGNVLRQAEQLRELGVKHTKNLPKPEDEESADEEPLILVASQDVA